MKVKITVEELLQLISQYNPVVLGSRQIEISAVASINKAEAGSLTFCKAEPGEALLIIKNSRASVIICREDIRPQKEDYKDKTLILVANPRLAFMKIVETYFQRTVEPGIHPTAVVDSEAVIRPRIYIGPHCTVGKCEIGEGTVIYGHVHIYDKVKIGKNVVIHAGTVIGADGFGYERNEEGKLAKFPHIGGVIIEDNVEIGSNTSIDRGTLDDTIIGEGSKIDNLCHIAHNVVIGKHCAIIANAMLGGSAKIGDGSWIAPSAVIFNGIKIGKNVTVGMGSIVTKDIEDNAVVFGAPAKPAEEYKKLLKALKKLIETQ